MYIAGNDYYSDGINSYCFRYLWENEVEQINQKNQAVYKIIFFLKEKSHKNTVILLKKVETTKTLKAIEDLRYLASDGEKFIKGEFIKNADLDTLKAVSEYNDDYFYDKNNVLL